MTTEFTDASNALETCVEVLAAIKKLYGPDYDDCYRVWEAPTRVQVKTIARQVERATSRHADEYCWGEEGANWANQA